MQWPQDPQEKLLVFRLENEDSSKSETVKHLSKLMADAHFSTDPVRPFSPISTHLKPPLLFQDQFVVSCSADVIHSLGRSANSTTIHRAIQYVIHTYLTPTPTDTILSMYVVVLGRK